MRHPIEAESYRILQERVDLTAWAAAERAVVARVIHASADLDYAATMWFSPGAAEAGVRALRRGAAVVADVEMVRHGITGVGASCYLGPSDRDGGEGAGGAGGEDLTRCARAMRRAAERHPEGAVVVVGCAPTALVEAIRLSEEGRLRPALVVGLPVGFVGAAESKSALRASGLPAIGNLGEKGGSAVAAAVVNALVRLASPVATKGPLP
ncbi:MAG: precorrin-8X methylmutase [Actinomycetota bacterium]|nr:precorrin-8X methylmutase [Actinomycetota bacterium]